MTATTTLYDILGLAPRHARATSTPLGYPALTKYYLIGAHGLSQADADAQNPGHQGSLVGALGPAGGWPTMRACSNPRHRPRPASRPLGHSPQHRKSASRFPRKRHSHGGKPSPMLIMLGIVGGLAIIGMLIQIFFSVFAFRQVSQTAGSDPAYEAHQARLMATRAAPHLRRHERQGDRRRRRKPRPPRRRAESVQREAELHNRKPNAARTTPGRKKSASASGRSRNASAMPRPGVLRAAARRGSRAPQGRGGATPGRMGETPEAGRRAPGRQEEQRRVQEHVARERARWQQELQR